MPELPEVETMVRGVRDALIGRTVIDLEQVPCDCKPIEMTPRFSTIRKRLKGQRIESVERLAKRIVVAHEGGQKLVLEPRMTGLMLLADPPDAGHLRLKWTLGGRAGPRHIWYWDRRGLGTCRLYSQQKWEQWRASGALGPDALSMTAHDFRQRLKSSSREVKVALLDQKTVAGIGNLYASEILHVAAIHPKTRCHRLTGRQFERLADATRQVLQDAIRYEGSTLSDGTYRNALNKAGGYQNRHRVYAKADEPCVRCGQGEIVRIVQAQRSTYFCPHCQTKRDSHRSAKSGVSSG
jgi:formamidopyrimidine-DNA glycosylase